jgi:hypothetical protein
MATIPVYITWVAGTVVSASQLQSQIRDAGNFFKARPYCLAFNAAGTSISNNSLSPLPLDGEVEDNDNMHSTSTNNSRLICQTPGVFDAKTYTAWSNNNTGVRLHAVRLNAAGSGSGGTSIVPGVGGQPSGIGAGQIITSLAFTYRFVNIGDYLEMFVLQNNTAPGGALAVGAGAYATGFSLMWAIA